MKKKNNKIIKLIIIAATVILLAVIGIFGIKKVINYMPYYFDKNGINQQDMEYTLTIDKADFENEVARRLEDEGVIVSAVRFLGYIHEKYPDFIWYNGEYKLNANMSYKELCEKLQTPDSRIDYVKFTVPEGKKVVDIAKIVEKAGLCTEKEFLEAADSYDYDFKYMDELKARKQSLVGYKLEGYLFPATYEIRKDTATPELIVQEMLTTFEGYVTDEYVQKAKAKGLSINELVSFGAVIQGEAFSKESMANISSVFWNRLNSPAYPRLESDPTMFYRDTLKLLDNYTVEMGDAYSTYSCTGLPVGPTNCPGLDVLDAVLAPSDTDYFYFVTDSNGEFYYNKTLAQHNATIRDLKNKGIWG
ncbi:MAG: endolytic transglycosylase MltG [Clostridia bacterium]|nr:endolytic transglycosylase MltG [Clostridia bacterium]